MQRGHRVHRLSIFNLHAMVTCVLVASIIGAIPLSASTDSAVRPAVIEIRKDVQNINAKTPQQVAVDLGALAPQNTRLSDDLLLKLATDLVEALKDRPINDPTLVAWIAGDIDQAFDPGPAGEEQVSSAISDIGSGLKKAGVGEALVEAIRADMRALFPESPGQKKELGPEHKYRYALSEAPRYDKTVPIEDFETVQDIFTTWYQPNWSVGVTPKIDPDATYSGTKGLTITRVGAFDTYNGFATVLKPARSIEGMNAIRMWIKPYGSDPMGGDKEARGSVTTGFIDGSDEIWQIEVPDLLKGDEPFILQIRLADFARMLRRNNGIIDMECRNYGFWMAGTYKFSVDDIRFVHDPALPEFLPAPSSKPIGVEDIQTSRQDDKAKSQPISACGFDEAAVNALRAMTKCAKELRIHGAAVVAYFEGDSVQSWSSKAVIVGAMKNAPTKETPGDNLLAIAYSKASEMAETLKNSGNAGRSPMTGEFGWPGGLLLKGKSGYWIAAFSGGPSEDDIKVSRAGLETLVNQ
jgi:hypothetical protein